MNRLLTGILMASVLLLAVGGESLKVLPSKAFLYKHGYEYIGKPVLRDARIPMLMFTTGDDRYIGSSFYTKHRQYTAQHVSNGLGGFTQIGLSDAAWRIATPNHYFEVNNQALTYRGDCTAYGYVDGVLRRYDGKITGTMAVITGPELLCNFRVRGGVSGGVVVDSKGLVLGVISATTLVDGKHVTMVIPIKEG